MIAIGGSWRDFLSAGHADAPVVAIVGSFLGAVMVRHRPRNPVGWLLVVNGVAQGAHVFSDRYAYYALRHGATGGDLAAWVGRPTLTVAALTLVLAILLLPDGRLSSPRWRLVAGAAIADVSAAVVLIGASSWELRGQALLDGHAPPTGGVGHALTVINAVGQTVIAVCGLLAVASAVGRYRRSTGIVRQQLRWCTFGAVLSVVLVVVSHVVGGIRGGLVAVVSPLPIMVGVTVAIRRYHLYDIDRLISRTASYVTLTAALTGTYLLLSTVLATALGSVDHGSTVATAAAAVVATALFQPLRHRLQDVSDRRFRRRSYEAQLVIARYLDGLRERDPAPGALRNALATALGDDTVAVAFWMPRYGAYVDEDGRTVDVTASTTADRAVTPLVREGERLGVLIHSRRVSDEDPDLLVTTSRVATVALDHGRLRAQVMTQLGEVRASRARIISAGDDERRRIERNLHDGAQQRLVALALRLRHARNRARRESAGALADELEATACDVDAALADVRSLAQGLVPQILADKGVGAAVVSLAERSPVPVTLDGVDDRRHSPEVETTAYFVVAEALVNVAKHARATRACVTLSVAKSRLSVVVTDDGAGGAALGSGSGLIGLRDRVEALGGSLDVLSPAGGGTLLGVELPLP